MNTMDDIILLDESPDSENIRDIRMLEVALQFVKGAQVDLRHNNMTGVGSALEQIEARLNVYLEGRPE